jgi:hypothetical protein
VNRRTDCDGNLVPFHRKDAATLGVEVWAIRCTTPLNNSTSWVAGQHGVTVPMRFPIDKLMAWVSQHQSLPLVEVQRTTLVPVKGVVLFARLQPVILFNI